ncbi:hypothetical protein GCM10011369_06230 [Neiella marina]|uniref:N-acylglucosamine 2-epimerase n=1 Tax=Neiella marina TaxID=508461 RepID=A0A8J2U2T0_9GAMM|nr:AGE family epimerase/isomerase [Neiella marina]GGA67324.1 hypothetical protein GCM10011369_06230 [Neiella marina]
MWRHSRLLFALCSLFVVNLSIGSAWAKEPPMLMPTAKQWHQHIEHNLVRYWMQPTAFGEPEGNFPTYRCFDGSLPDPKALCEALDQPWIKPLLGRQYTRMISRQVYTYGVIYHLTGNERALALAKSGIDYLLAYHYDRTNGGFVSYLEHGKPGLNWRQRPSQDQSYALVGLAFYYYLTRDSEVEKVLIDTQNFIFDKYRNETNNELYWVLEDSDDNKAKQQELVAQLDQINAYMLMAGPLLPKQHELKWKTDLAWLTEVLVNNYHSTEQMRFYGGIHHAAAKASFGRHNDYGHTVKAYWMLYLAADYLGREDWIALATDGIELTLERALNFTPIRALADTEARQQLISHFGADGDTYFWRGDENSMYAAWWQWAELDQAAML